MVKLVFTAKRVNFTLALLIFLYVWIIFKPNPTLHYCALCKFTLCMCTSAWYICTNGCMNELIRGGCDLIFYFLLFSAPKLLQILSANGAVSMIPELAKAIDIFTVIPATSCSAERSFSSLRRLKTYHCQVWLCCI